jgi:glyoxylase-like metal-dependent hydrolase (beta-lactamase superfamily II)
MSDVTEVYALRYATMYGRKASEIYFRYDLYGLEDRTLDMACYFWMVRRGSEVTLVDSGWNRFRGLPKTERYRHLTVDETDPIALLARLGVSPQDVTNVIVSHMHFDHVGNLDLFPQADVFVARAEYECWTGPLASNPALSLSIFPEEVAVVEKFRHAERLHLVEQASEIIPGIVASPVGGHTPGQMLVDVVTDTGTIVLATDAAHYHEELDENRPFYHYSDLVATLETYATLRERATRPQTRIVSGHDPIEMTRYTPKAEDVVDLTRPLN